MAKQTKDGQLTLSDEEAEALRTLSVLGERASTARGAGLQFGGARDIFQELGYPRDLSVGDYQGRYDRDGLSARIIDKPAKDTWRTPPKITDDGATDTPFVEALDAINKRLKLWKALTNVDRISGVGQFGVLLLGVKGDGTLADPLDGKLSGPDDLIYLRPYGESSVGIKTFEKDDNSARFALPNTYEIEPGKIGSSALPKQTVHWTRVIHVAEDSFDEVIGTPRLQHSFNRILDLEKVLGSGAEAFWRLVLKGYALTEKEGWNIEDSADELEDTFLDYIHNLKRILVLGGVDVNELGNSETPDPSGLFKVLIAVIAADIDMPQNVFIGSEQGIRASDVDAINWAGAIDNRQQQFAEPMILRPTIDWMIEHVVIPAPQSGSYDVEWSPLYQLSEVERVEQGEKKSNIVGEVARSGAVELGLLTVEEGRGWADLDPTPVGTTIDDLLDVEDDMDEVAPELDPEEESEESDAI